MEQFRLNINVLADVLHSVECEGAKIGAVIDYPVYGDHAIGELKDSSQSWAEFKSDNMNKEAGKASSC